MDLKNSVRIKSHVLAVDNFDKVKEILSNTVFEPKEYLDTKGMELKEWQEDC